MPRIQHTVRILADAGGSDDLSELIHLPGATDQYETVCGFVDTVHEDLDAVEYPPTCKACAAIARYCRLLRLPDGSCP